MKILKFSLVFSFLLNSYLFSFSNVSSCCLTKYQEDSLVKSNIENIYNTLTANYAGFHSYQIKFSVEYSSNDDSQSFTCLVRSVKDSIIWISATAKIGIEVARIVLTPDSMKFMDKIDNLYYLGNYDLTKQLFRVNLNFNILQAIFNNEFFVYDLKPEQYNLKSGFSFDSVSSPKVIRYDKDFVHQSITINSSGKHIEKVQINDQLSGKQITIHYQSFQTIDDKKYPEKISLNISDDYGYSRFKLTNEKINLKKSLEFPFKIPDDYKPMY